MKDNLSFENIGINGENIKVSKWGYYCIISAKGNEKSVFENDSNVRRYLNGLYRNKNKAGISIWAVCCMPDKLHIIFGNTTVKEIKKMLRSVNAGYATYSKFIMEKVEFQRTTIVLIEEADKLLDYFKYICCLPVNCRNYKWSSLMKYLNYDWEYAELIDTSFLFDLLKCGESNNNSKIENLIDSIKPKSNVNHKIYGRVNEINVSVTEITDSNEIMKAKDIIAEYLTDFYCINLDNMTITDAMVQNMVRNMERERFKKMIENIRGTTSLPFRTIALLCCCSHSKIYSILR